MSPHLGSIAKVEPPTLTLEVDVDGVRPVRPQTLPPGSARSATAKQPFRLPRLEFVIGDLTAERTEAIVSPSSPQLVGGGLVNLAVHRVAGPSLASVCNEMVLAREPLKPGDAVLTPAFHLPCRHVIHSVAGSYRPGDSASLVTLVQCYRRVLQLAREHGIDSVSFPAFGTLAFGYPVQEAAPAAADTVIAELQSGGAPSLVRFVLFGPSLFYAYTAAAETHLARPRSL